MLYDIRLDVRELKELKRLIETAGEKGVLEQINLTLFQSRLKPDDWFKVIETGEVYQAYDVDEELVWYFDPYTQSESAWVKRHQVAPATEEEIERAKKHHDELYRLYEERDRLIGEILRERFPTCSLEWVEELEVDDYPEEIIHDGKLIGHFARIGSTIYYTVNVRD